MDSAGNAVHSADVSFTTGALPAGVPSFTATGTASGSGLTLVARVQDDPAPDYATIVDGSAALVWYVGIPDGGSLQSDFQQQPDGTFTLSVPVATLPLLEVSVIYYQVDVLGNVTHVWTALGPDGSGRVVDTEGNQITIVATDLHELRLQPDGSALLFGYTEQTMNLESFGGKAAAEVYFSVLERVASSGQVELAWNSAESVSPTDADPSVVDLTARYVGLTHGNSIDVMADGNYLISLRNVSQVRKLDSSSGAVLWVLGGAGVSAPSSGGPTGDFKFVNDPLNGFSCQHGARELTNGDILLFDDGNGHSPPQSRAVEYALDTNAMTATLVWQSTPSTSLYTSSQGFAQRLSNGNTLVDYGEAATTAEWDPSGSGVVWSVSETTGTKGFYRSFRLGSLYSFEPP